MAKTKFPCATTFIRIVCIPLDVVLDGGCQGEEPRWQRPCDLPSNPTHQPSLTGTTLTCAGKGWTPPRVFPIWDNLWKHILI